MPLKFYAAIFMLALWSILATRNDYVESFLTTKNGILRGVPNTSFCEKLLDAVHLVPTITT